MNHLSIQYTGSLAPKIPNTLELDVLLLMGNFGVAGAFEGVV